MNYYLLKVAKYYRENSPIANVFCDVKDAILEGLESPLPTSRDILINNWARILPALKAGYPDITEVKLIFSSQGRLPQEVDWDNPKFAEGEYTITGKIPDPFSDPFYSDNRLLINFTLMK